jgi:hypothetical protein
MTHKSGAIPGVFVVPVYVEVPDDLSERSSLQKIFSNGLVIGCIEGNPCSKRWTTPGKHWRTAPEGSGRRMAQSEQEYLREPARKNICPNCEKQIAEGRRHPYGAGVFCSLDCVAEFNAVELVERAKRISELAERHRSS